jgi:hypothetical protein
MAQDLCPTGVLSINGEPSQSQVAQLYMSITGELFPATGSTAIYSEIGIDKLLTPHFGYAM